MSAEGVRQRKVFKSAKSPSNSYLYLGYTNKVYSVGEHLTVNYNSMNPPTEGFIYYMVRPVWKDPFLLLLRGKRPFNPSFSQVLSRGVLIKKGSLKIGLSVRDILPITMDMVPSFRLIGYYYDQSDNIIADSVWVDVRDECEINVKVSKHKR